jgi:hypothetical protein
MALSDDDILDKVRAYAEVHRLPAPASSEAAAELEAAVGHPLPLLLRRLYCEAANGGFGADGVVSLAPSGRWFSDEESLLQVHQEWSKDELGDLYPHHVLPIMSMGCAIWWCIDLSTPEGRMWGWDPHRGCQRHYLFPESCTLAEWLTDWLQGNRTFPYPPEPSECPDC